MRQVQIAVVGGGPAGLSAALAAAGAGAKVAIIDENPDLGGQLVKQTHPFFGSEEQQAGTRGVDIAKRMVTVIGKQSDKIEVLANSTVTGIFPGSKTITYLDNGNNKESFEKLQSDRIIVATGASENMLAFPNNDLPGVYGAGAVQTLMNVYGIKVGKNVLMVGSGNVGLIVSYQLMQAGINVEAVVEAAPKTGGYQVHADKLKLLGVPIYTRHTVKEVHGGTCVEGATIVELDEKWKPKAGSEKTLDVDTVCLAVGLTPLADLLWQGGCKMTYVPELGGYVPFHDKNTKTSVDWVYIAGDVSGIEEASTALVEGRLAGLCAAKSLGLPIPQGTHEEIHRQLDLLRSGPFGEARKKAKMRLLL